MAFDFSQVFKKPDFNGDGRADYLWRNAETGGVGIWLGNGASLLGSSALPITVPTSTKIETADFDGDGKTDLFLRNGITGENQILLMNGLSIKQTLSLITVPVTANGWDYTFGDFNNDKKTDFFWRNNTTGDTGIWLDTSGRGPVFNVPISWTVDLADFNGDGKTDLFWRNVNQPTTDPTYGQNAVWLMDGRTPVSQTFLIQTPAGYEYDFADFNGDGKTDLFWRFTTPGSSETGRNYIWLMEGGIRTEGKEIIQLALSWDYDIADFNGDGKTDFFWRNGENGLTDTLYNLPVGANAIWLMSGTQVVSTNLLDTVPLSWTYDLGDFNGDKKTDFFWRNAIKEGGTPENGDGLNQLWLVNGNTVASKSNLPSLSTYYSTTNGDWNFSLADFNGDGTTDIFWRNTDVNDLVNGAKNGVWVIQNGAIANLPAGATTAQAVANFGNNGGPNGVFSGQATVPVGDPQSTEANRVLYRWYLVDPALNEDITEVPLTPVSTSVS